MNQRGPLCSYTTASHQAYILDERDLYEAATAEFFDTSGPGCPCCRAVLRSQVLETSRLGSTWSIDLLICEECGWWLAHRTSSDDKGNRIIKAQLRGEAKHYRVSDLDAPLETLRRYLAKHPEYLTSVHHRQFELLMADCLRERFGEAEVIHTGGTADGGIDLKMILTNGETYLVQVKRRTDLDSKEGVQVVRELNGVLFREGVARGIIITGPAQKGATRT